MTHIEQRIDDAAVWTAQNPVLHRGEAGHEDDTGKWKVGDGTSAWNDLPYKMGVDSVAGQTGEVDLVVGDVEGAAPLASPIFTGTPKAPTKLPGTNDTSIATTAFVKIAISALIGGAPALLDTLNEIAAAINDDEDFATTITTALAEMGADLDTKAPLASPVLTGNPSAPTPATSDNDTTLATTAFVKAVMNAYIASGVVAGIPAGTAYVDVSFPPGRFSVPPVVQVSTSATTNTAVVALYDAVTVDGFRAYFYTLSDSATWNAGVLYLNWSAQLPS